MIKNHAIYKDLYTDKDKFIILVTGGRGCEDPDTPIMMADLTIKPIKDIKVGDKVMGDDGTPRNVLHTLSGRSKMYHVHQTNAEDYVVNDAHILTLRKKPSAMKPYGESTRYGTPRHPNGRYPQYGAIADIPIEEYIGKSERFKNNFLGVKSSSIAYPYQDVLIEPYMLGLWLGDGTAMYPRLTNPDEEIVEYIEDYCARHNQVFKKEWSKGAYRIGAVSEEGKIGSNDFLNKLKSYNLINNKHIPQEYISNSENVRLELLAGLIDTDGSYDPLGDYEIIQKSEPLARQIKFIADTLGFRTSIRTKKGRIGEKDYGLYYRVSISGDIKRIPCKVRRKQCFLENYQHRSWLTSRLTITENGIGDWCGMILDGNHRYLHADGTITHNSGKSFALSCFIERLTFELGEWEGKRIAHQILYTRYTMVSASISVIPEFLEKVDADGTTKYFHKTKTDVINKSTDSHVMFRGINTSSGNQTAKLKSIHGITTFVVDEAEEWTNEQEFDTIMLSIRQKGLQNRIIIIMNPTDSNHFIYQRYIKDTHRIEVIDGVPVQISTHPNVLHIHTTYLNNLANLNEQFLQEVKTMKEQNQEKYAHIVMGQWSDVAEGAVFKKWGIVDEFPANAKNVGRGLDFGFVSDPSACVKFGEVWTADGVDLYLDEQFYQTGMLISDLIRELKKDPTFVYADSADPRLIDEIALGGVIIYGVQKGAGSIVAGIEKIKDYRNIFVTKRSYNLQTELRNYTWDKDKNGNYISQPIDAYNHACFVADTGIVTNQGVKRIADIKVGDVVFNSDGWHKVKQFFDNGEQEVFDYILRYGDTIKKVTCTPNHKIKTDKGWKHISELREGDNIYLVSSSMVKNIESTKGSDILAEGARDCMLKCGDITMAMYPKAIISTIRMRIQRIMTLAILKWWKLQNILATMCKNDSKTQWSCSVLGNTWQKLVKLQRIGINPKKVINGMLNMAKKQQKLFSQECISVSNAERNFGRNLLGQTDSVQTTASLHGVETRDLTTRNEFANGAERPLSLTNTTKLGLVHGHAAFNYPAKNILNKGNEIVKVTLSDVKAENRRIEHVYNFEVEEVHEYFANGILVSNCDAARYGVMGKIMGKVIRKEMKQQNAGKKPVSYGLN